MHNEEISVDSSGYRETPVQCPTDAFPDISDPLLCLNAKDRVLRYVSVML